MSRALDGRAHLADEPPAADHGVEESRPPARVHADQDVVEGREVEAQAARLEGPGDPEPRDRVGLETRQSSAEEDHVARGGRQEAGERVEERGLPRAVRPDHADRLPLRDHDVHAVEGHEPPEAHREAGDLQQAHCWSGCREAGTRRGWRAVGTAWLRPANTRDVTGISVSARARGRGDGRGA